MDYQTEYQDNGQAIVLLDDEQRVLAEWLNQHVLTDMASLIGWQSRIQQHMDRCIDTQFQCGHFQIQLEHFEIEVIDLSNSVKSTSIETNETSFDRYTVDYDSSDDWDDETAFDNTQLHHDELLHCTRGGAGCEDLLVLLHGWQEVLES